MKKSGIVYCGFGKLALAGQPDRVLDTREIEKMEPNAGGIHIRMRDGSEHQVSEPIVFAESEFVMDSLS